MHYATIEESGRLNRMIGKKSDLERQKNNVLDDLCRFFREIRIFWSTTMPDFNRAEKKRRLQIVTVDRNYLLLLRAGLRFLIFLKRSLRLPVGASHPFYEVRA